MRRVSMLFRQSMTFKYPLPSKTLVKYTIVSLLSFAIDFAIFTSLHFLMVGLFIPLIIARIISGSFNFYQNKVLVYRAQKTGRVKQEVISYCLLAVIVFCFGCAFISLFVLHLHLNIILAKVIVDAILFFSNYLIQKWVIFYRKS